MLTKQDILKKVNIIAEKMGKKFGRHIIEIENECNIVIYFPNGVSVYGYGEINCNEPNKYKILFQKELEEFSYLEDLYREFDYTDWDHDDFDY